jgi:hypothetical protein
MRAPLFLKNPSQAGSLFEIRETPMATKMYGKFYYTLKIVECLQCEMQSTGSDARLFPFAAWEETFSARPRNTISTC